MRHRQPFRTIFSIALIFGGALLPLPALAQSCSADSQCPGAGMMRTTCQGNSVVTARSVCAGSCQMVEVSRVPCAGACSGGSCIDLSSPRAPASSLPRALSPCPRECACRDGRMITTTGLRDVDGTCLTRVQRCAKGCACAPSPRCTP